MSSTNPELGSRVTEYASVHPRLLYWSRVILAILALLALALNSVLIAALLLVVLSLLLLLPMPQPAAPDHDATLPNSPLQRPLIEDVARQLSMSLSISQVANIVLSAALRATRAEEATLALPVEVDHYLTIVLRRDQDQVQMIHRTKTGNSLIEQVLEDGGTLFNRERTAVAVALRHEYSVIGVLCIECQAQTFTQAEVALLNEIAIPASVSLYNAHLMDEQQHQIDTLSYIQALTLRLAGTVDRGAVAEAVLETARDILGVQEIGLYHYHAERDQLEPVLSLHRDRFSSVPNVIRLSQAIALKSAQSGKIQINGQPLTCVGVPVGRGGVVRDVLAAVFIEHHTLRNRDLNTLTLLANQAVAYLDTVELHEKVRDFSERLRVTIASARDGVLLLDRDGTLLECNPSAERLLGIDKETFVGKHFVAMLFEMMKASELHGLGYSRSQLTVLARQLRLDPSNISRRQFAQVNANQTVHIEEIGSPVIDANNQIIGRLLVLRDMTEQKLLADFRDEITHMAVHDLRGPLTAVINGLDMTLRLGDVPADSERVLRLSMESARSLMRLVDSLLDIAKLESRRMPINPQPVVVAELVEAARQTLLNSITEAHVQVESQIADPQLPPLNVDPDLMRRVLINLIDNAVRFTPQGGEVLITAARRDVEQVAICIADSGPGIPPEDRALIFEQYRQSGKNKPLRGSKGTGLGLTFCKLAVEAHGGTISAEASERLSGACFVISLPIANHDSAI